MIILWAALWMYTFPNYEKCLKKISVSLLQTYTIWDLSWLSRNNKVLQIKAFYESLCFLQYESELLFSLSDIAQFF